MTKATKKVASQAEAMRAKVAKDRRAAHDAIQSAEDCLHALSDRLERRTADQAKARAARGLGA